MPLIASRETEKEYELTPADTHVGTCYRIIDLGTQMTPWKDERTGAQKRQHLVMISWELDALMSDGKPFNIHRRYTLSLHEKSALCKDLEAWRGRPFTDKELESFDLTTILGTSCLIGVAHKANEKGKVFANISSILRLPKGMTAPALVNPKLCLILKPNEFDYDAFAKLSDSMRDTIRLSPEYAECMKKLDEEVHDAEELPPHVTEEVPLGVTIGY